MNVRTLYFPDLGTDDAAVVDILVQPGQTVVVDQPLVVLESAKASMEIPCTASGLIQEILVLPGQSVQSGDPLLVLGSVEAAESASASHSRTLMAALQEVSAALTPVVVPVAPELSVPQAEVAEAQQGTVGVQTLLLPDLGIEEATVVAWLLKPGDWVSAGQAVLLLESAKATVEVPCPVAGQLLETLLTLAQVVHSGEPMLRLRPEVLGGQLPVIAGIETQEAQQAEASAAMVVAAVSVGGAHAGPAVRRLARELGVDLLTVTGSGPHQRILKKDVQAYVRQRLQNAAVGSAVERTAMPEAAAEWAEQEKLMQEAGAVYQPFTRIQRLSARHLAQAHAQVVPVTQFEQVDITELEKFRQSQKALASAQGVSLTLLPFLVKALALMLEKYPRFNSELRLDGAGIYQKNAVNIAFAVDTPTGLFVPVLKNCASLGMFALARRIDELTQLARQQKLRPEHLSQGSISISSLGSIGGTGFTPVVNWPQVAIVGVSQARVQPVWQGQGVQPRLLLPLALTYDHRVIDGALAVRFLVDYAALLEDIRQLLL